MNKGRVDCHKFLKVACAGLRDTILSDSNWLGHQPMLYVIGRMEPRLLTGIRVRIIGKIKVERNERIKLGLS